MCVYIYIHIYIYMCVYVCVCMYVCVIMHACMYESIGSRLNLGFVLSSWLVQCCILQHFFFPHLTLRFQHLPHVQPTSLASPANRASSVPLRQGGAAAPPHDVRKKDDSIGGAF